jgi:hypothetical protein
MTEHTDIPPVAGETTDPAVTRVLHALTADLHESLCNCRKYPDQCASTPDYRRDDLIHTFGYAEAALEEALKQGWTPPVAGASSVSDDVVEIALAASLEHDVLNPGDGAFASLRAAIAAALPHLTAERDAETTALREGVKQIAWGLRLAASDFVKEFGNGPSDTRDVLGRVLDLATGLASPASAVLVDPAPSTPAAQEG